jgi:hypothetical protein
MSAGWKHPAVRPRDQAARLQVRVHPGQARDPDMLADQDRQAAAFGQRQQRDQPGVRHEIPVIKRRLGPCGAMRQSHLTGAP